MPTPPSSRAVTDGPDPSDGSDGSDGNPLSAAGLWDNERPPRTVRIPVEDADGAGGGTDTAAGAAAAAGAAGQRTMTHGPDGRRARRAGATPPKRQRDPVRTTVRGVGQLLITAGVVVLLFVVYELWITNIFGGHRQAEATAALDKLWATEQVTVTQGGVAVVTGAARTRQWCPAAPPLTNQTGARSRHYDTQEGSGFAKLYIPSFGADFVFTVIEGTDENDLYSGPGHYLGTQYPGDPGNFAMAGHRVNKGAPFNDLDLLNPCDAIVIETVDAWYVYRMLPTEQESAGWSSAAHQHCDGVEAQTGQYAGVYGREITSPSDYQQVLPVPASEQHERSGRCREADHPDDLQSEVLRRPADDHPWGDGEELPEERQLPPAGAGGDDLMYGWIWRHLPGPTPMRVVSAVFLFLMITAVLFFLVFPWLEPYMPFDHATTG